jgi:hypothetical protein
VDTPVALTFATTACYNMYWTGIAPEALIHKPVVVRLTTPDAAAAEQTGRLLALIQLAGMQQQKQGLHTHHIQDRRQHAFNGANCCVHSSACRT